MMSFSVQLGIVKSLSLKRRERVSLSESTDGWTWIMAYGDPSALWSHRDLQFPEPSFWVTGGLHRVPSMLPGFSGGEEVPANQKSIICLQGTTRRPVGFTAPILFSTTHPVFDSRIPSQLILPILHSHQREMDIGENKLFHQQNRAQTWQSQGLMEALWKVADVFLPSLLEPSLDSSCIS